LPQRRFGAQAAMVVAETLNERNQTMTNGTNQARKHSQPTHYAYTVRDRKDQKGFFTKIGAAWANADGRGFSIQLDAIPFDGRITLRQASEKTD
jgi:hypothetical protein